MDIDIDELLGKYSKYLKGDSVGGASNFRHVTGHLIQIAMFDHDSGNKTAFDKDIGTIRKYVRLLDDFPVFREEQLTKDSFPHGNHSSCVAYVERMDKKLRKKQGQ